MQRKGAVVLIVQHMRCFSAIGAVGSGMVGAVLLREIGDPQRHSDEDWDFLFPVEIKHEWLCSLARPESP